MKRNIKTKAHILSLVLALIFSSTVFFGCSDDTDADSYTSRPSEESGTIDDSNPESGGNRDIEKDKYEEQISYYMELTEALQAQLLVLKEQSYIDECEYKMQISALQQEIKALQAMAGASDKAPSLNEQTRPLPEQTSSKSEFNYTIQNSEITITAYTGSSADVVIPSSIDGLPVTKIGQSAFEGMSVTSIVIPSGTKVIDWFAFSGCTSLRSVTVPKSISRVEYGAFSYCPKDMRIICEKGSYIETYALSWGIATITE